jgi:hypothetical protein
MPLYRPNGPSRWRMFRIIPIIPPISCVSPTFVTTAKHKKRWIKLTMPVILSEHKLRVRMWYLKFSWCTLLGCNTLYFGKQVPVFLRDIFFQPPCLCHPVMLVPIYQNTESQISRYYNLHATEHINTVFPFNMESWICLHCFQFSVCVFVSGLEGYLQDTPCVMALCLNYTIPVHRLYLGGGGGVESAW